jgi:hypothetical protein
MMAIAPVLADTGQLAPGQTWGNDGASQSPALPVNSITTSIATLKALTPRSNSCVVVLGYTISNDGGGGRFCWNAAVGATDNGGTIIQQTAGGTGRWIRQLPNVLQYSPEMFGSLHNGSADDVPPIDAANVALNALGGGYLALSCNTTYNMASISGNGQSVIRLFSNIRYAGCGDSTIIRFANNLNTSSSFFAWGMYATGTANDVYIDHLAIDQNGANNSCGGTCYHSNASIGIATGKNIYVSYVHFLNNPGSNDTVFGTDIVTPSVQNLHLSHLTHEHYGDIVNSASADFSADFAIASNYTYDDMIYSDGPRVNGAAFEIHGDGFTGSNLVVTDNFNCGIVSNEPVGANTNGVALTAVKCNNVQSGLQVASFASVSLNRISLSSIIVNFLSGYSGIGLDACTLINASTGINTSLVLVGINVNSAVTSNLSTNSPGICIGPWANATIVASTTYNTQGPGLYFSASAAGAALTAVGNTFVGVGWGANTSYEAGIVAAATSGVTAGTINFTGNTTTGGNVRNSVLGALNSTGGSILNNPAPGASVNEVTWTGTGNVKLPTNVAGGSSGQIQYNNSGVFAGFTASGDCTVVVATGVFTCLKTNGTALGPFATATSIATSALIGALQAAQEPAHTGDVTNTAGSLVLSYTNIVPVAKGGTGNAGGAWSTWSPTLACNGSGTITQGATNSADVYQVGKLVNFEFDVVLTTSTCSAGISITLPATALHGNSLIIADRGNGVPLYAFINAGGAVAVIQTISSTTPANGARLIASGSYQSN